MKGHLVLRLDFYKKYNSKKDAEQLIKDLYELLQPNCTYPQFKKDNFLYLRMPITRATGAMLKLEPINIGAHYEE